jgi:ATP-dependent Lhr-like helicase
VLRRILAEHKRKTARQLDSIATLERAGAAPPVADSVNDAPLSPRDWFAAQGWSPFAFQEEVWAAHARGESGLIHAPTGMGKTYAAWMGPLAAGPEGEANAPPALTVLWITPLRALAGDTVLALRRAAGAIKPHWTVDARTGDTSSSARTQQNKRLPTALVTTPESLTLLLSRADWRERFAQLSTVIVDEWLELLST